MMRYTYLLLTFFPMTLFCQLPIHFWEYEKLNGKIKQIAFFTITDSLMSWRRDYLISYDHKGQITVGKMITGDTHPDTTYIDLSYTLGRVELQIDKLNTANLNGINCLYLYHYKQIDGKVSKMDRKNVYTLLGYYNYPTIQYNYIYHKDSIVILKYWVNQNNGKIKKRHGEKDVLCVQNNLLKYSTTYYWSTFLGYKYYKILYSYKYTDYVLDAQGNWTERTVDWYLNWMGQKLRTKFKEKRVITYY